MSSPPVRMLAVPHAVIRSVRGQSPWSWRWRSMRRLADFQPKAHAVGVGTARESTEKKLRPVGRTSMRPRVGAPEGAGGTNWPLRAVRSPSDSAGPQARTVGRMCVLMWSRMALVLGISGNFDPSMSCVVNSSSRSTVSPVVRHALSSRLAEEFAAVGRSKARPFGNRGDRS